MRSLAAARAALVLTLPLAASCVPLDAVLPGAPNGGRTFDPAPPDVRVADVRLVERPTPEALADHFCRRELPGFLCGRFFTAGEKRFAFELDLEVGNPNPVPVPVIQALVAFRAFPDGAAGGRNLGALCVSLCDDPARCPQDAADACRASDPEIRDLDDLQASAVGYLIGLATGERRLEDLRVRTVPANETLRATVRLEVDTPTMLGLMETAGQGWGESLRQGRIPDFAIPFELEGAAWIRVETFGRFAANFGPARGRWELGEAL